MKQPFNVTLTYYFPVWFIARALVVHLEIDRFNDLTLRVTVRNVVPYNSDLFLAAERGSVDELKDLIIQRKASPNDVEDKVGRSALQVSHIDHLWCSSRLISPSAPLLIFWNIVAACSLEWPY